MIDGEKNGEYMIWTDGTVKKCLRDTNFSPEEYPPAWESDPDGYHYDVDNPEDKRRNYNGGLWNLNKSHDKQASWYPGADPTLWMQRLSHEKNWL